MTAHGNVLCSHCSLPVGRRAMERAVNGESCAFCCYGCCIAFQVKSGKSEEWEAAWLLIQLGVGGFLSMNIMMFSLLLYSDAFTGVDASVLPWIHLLLWCLRDARGPHARGPLSARDVAQWHRGARDVIGAHRARRRRRVRLLDIRHDRARRRTSISTRP